jgi:hypothetical protein
MSAGQFSWDICPSLDDGAAYEAYLVPFSV